MTTTFYSHFLSELLRRRRRKTDKLRSSDLVLHLFG